MSFHTHSKDSSVLTDSWLFVLSLLVDVVVVAVAVVAVVFVVVVVVLRQ